MDGSKSNGFSISSMACGIVSVVFPGALGILLGIVALVMRAVYKNRNGGNDNSETKAGFITGIIGIILSVVVFIMIIVLACVGANLLFNFLKDEKLLPEIFYLKSAI